MKESSKKIKERILNDIYAKRIVGIEWLQKEYGIALLLAKEIYNEIHNKN